MLTKSLTHRGFDVPKYSFGEHTFSKVSIPNLVLLTPLKMASKIRILSLFILPKSSFGSIKMKCGFSKTFSRVWVLDLGYDPLKSYSKIRISSFVQPSKSSCGGIKLLHKVIAPPKTNTSPSYRQNVQ